MRARRLLPTLAGLVLALGVAAPGPLGAAEETPPPPRTPAEAGLPLLYVQNAEEMRFDGTTLTLGGLGPTVLYFAERPSRLVGSLPYPDFVKRWNEGADAFAADPPNAALSLLARPEEPPVVVELLQAALSPDALSYKVRVLEGTLPAEGGPVSLFIDHGGGHGGGGGRGGGSRGGGGMHWADGAAGRGSRDGVPWDTSSAYQWQGCHFNKLFGVQTCD